jgi:hypothetical protein
MARTIWVALFCLGAISTIASVRFVSSALGYVVTGSARPSAQLETTGIDSNVKNETLAKADRLPVDMELASFEPAIVAPIKIDPVVPSVRPVVTESIVSRHWHDPNPLVRSSKPAASRKSKEAMTNKKRRSMAEAGCSEGKPRTLLQSLNRSPGCSVASTLPAKRGPTAR